MPSKNTSEPFLVNSSSLNPAKCSFTFVHYFSCLTVFRDFIKFDLECLFIRIFIQHSLEQCSN